MIKIINDGQRARVQSSPAQLTVETIAGLTLPISHPSHSRFSLDLERHTTFDILSSNQSSCLANNDFGYYLQMHSPGDSKEDQDERLLLVAYEAAEINFDTPKVYGGVPVVAVGSYVKNQHPRRSRILLANLDHENGAVILPIRDMTDSKFIEFRTYTWKGEVKTLSPMDYPKYVQKLHRKLVTETLNSMLKSSPLAEDPSWLKLYDDRLTVFCPGNTVTPSRREYYDVSEQRAEGELARLAAKLPYYEQVYLAYQEAQGRET